MLVRKLSVLKELADALPKEEIQKRAAMPFIQELQEAVQETVRENVKEAALETIQEAVGMKPRGERIAMPFLHDMTPDIITEWNLADFDPAGQMTSRI